MKRGIISIIICVLFFCTLPVRAVLVTTTYEFLPEQSNVIKCGGIRGTCKTFSVEGQFQLTVDYDAGVASFARVDATLSSGSSIDNLFNMTGLDGTVISDTIIDFEGQTLDYPFDVYLQVALMNPEGQIHLTGGFVQNVPDGSGYDLDAVAVVIPEPSTLLLIGLGGLFVGKGIHRHTKTV